MSSAEMVSPPIARQAPNLTDLELLCRKCYRNHLGPAVTV